MLLYKIEIETDESSAHLVLLAESDEQAFSLVESHVARHYIRMPVLRGIAIVEKKRVEPGTGYVIPS